MTAEIMQDAGDEVLARVAHDGVQLVDLLFSDITGGAKSLTIPAELLAPTLAHGYRFDGAALTGGVRLIELDLYLVPDPATLAIYPTAEGGHRRARLCCTVRRRDGQAFAGDPRSVLERTLAAVSAAGFDYQIGLEIEFYLFQSDPSDLRPPLDPAGYFDYGEDVVVRTRDEIVSTLREMGVAISGAHHETGPGQEELDFTPTSALRMADQVMTVRQLVRSVAQRRGLRASFMPKPLTEAPGSGMHIFQRLTRQTDGSDALREGWDELSPTARHAIAGQLAHAPGMCAVVCPTVNSYKRLAAGHRAPRHATWARVSQASLIRMPLWAPDEDAAIEFRAADATANPYLALAVAAASLLEGIRLGEEPPAPLDESLVAYDDAELERLGVPALPATLGDALETFADDEVMRTTLGDYIFQQLLSVKQAEWQEYRRYVSPWEHARYGDV